MNLVTSTQWVCKACLLDGCQTSSQTDLSQNLIITRKEIPPFLIVTVFISLDLVKRSWFLYPDHSHCNEGSSPLLLCSGNKLVTPHLFLEPRADTRTNGRHQPCPARCGWGCSLLIVSDQEMLVGKGELLLLQDIKDQITPKGAGATLSERSNHSPDLPGSPA